MEILNLSKLNIGEVVNGVCLVNKCSAGTTKTGNTYLSGSFSYKGLFVPFKVWDNALVYKVQNYLNSNSLVGFPFQVTAQVTEYNSALELKITNMDPVPTEAYPVLAFKKQLDTVAISNRFNSIIGTYVSEKGKNLLGFLFSQENVGERFMLEQAAKSHHDHAIGGLLSHTTKMLELGICLVGQHPEFTDDSNPVLQDYVDLFLLGLTLHDIGKVFEMHYGEYTEKSYVTHRILGIEFITRYKDVIVQTYNEDFFYQLCAVMSGHHGEYGDAPKTVVTYMVHLVDMLDSQVTGIFEGLADLQVVSAAKPTIKVGDYFLRF